MCLYAQKKMNNTIMDLQRSNVALMHAIRNERGGGGSSVIRKRTNGAVVNEVAKKKCENLFFLAYVFQSVS